MKNKKYLYWGLTSVLAFALWTAVIMLVYRRPIGVNETYVGLSTVNQLFHNITGVHMSLYTITDWLGIIPFLFVFLFAVCGVIQWIKRKNILKVDYDLLALGVFYTVVFTLYILFEFVTINYRPILINGICESSYPSSTTMLVMCVMPTAIIPLRRFIKTKTFRIIKAMIYIFTIFMVIGRLLSGVHWLTDIIGGLLVSTGLILIYKYFTNKKL